MKFDACGQRWSLIQHVNFPIKLACTVIVVLLGVVTSQPALADFTLVTGVSGGRGSWSYSGSLNGNPTSYNTIRCFVSGTCETTWTAGTQVTVNVTAQGFSTFTGWSGDCSGTGNCNVTMDAGKTVTADFITNVPNYSLSVSVVGSGGIMAQTPQAGRGR